MVLALRSAVTCSSATPSSLAKVSSKASRFARRSASITVRAAIAPLPRSCWLCRCASSRGLCGRHPSRAGAGPRRAASARPSRSPPSSRHRPSMRGGAIPSQSSPGSPSALSWPLLVLLFSVRLMPLGGCSVPFRGSFLRPSWGHFLYFQIRYALRLCFIPSSPGSGAGAVLCPLLGPRCIRGRRQVPSVAALRPHGGGPRT